MLRILSLCLCLSTAVSFTTPQVARPTVSCIPTAGSSLHANNPLQDVDDRSEEEFLPIVSSNNLSILPAVILAMIPNMAGAAGPDWGLFEGRTGSLLHPAMMFSLLAYSIATALLGFQWRRQRTMGDEISSLKAQIPKDSDPEAPKSAATIELESQIASLQAERKELAGANPRDKHFSQGALLAFIGTAFAIEGPLNTYARAGKLFPGPHLYAGAGLVVLWALAASCVPAMQKGNDTARYVHIGANLTGMGLFAWQVVSGVPILFKVLEFTKWP